MYPLLILTNSLYRIYAIFIYNFSKVVNYCYANILEIFNIGVDRMDIKIVFSDIDGTFLTNDHKVTQKTIQAVKSLISQNIQFGLVSARMPEAIYPIINKINVKIPIISYSGALVLNEDQEVLCNMTIDSDSTTNILNEISNCWHDVTINYYAGHQWFIKNIDKRVENEMNITEATAKVADFNSLINQNIMPNKILVMCEPETCKIMENQLSEKIQNINVVRSSDILLEIMDKSVSKAVGIDILLKHYGFNIENSLAFGDNYNDIEMLKFAGRGIAMGNAPMAVKNIADNVTSSNEDDGIYKYLTKVKLIL